MSANAAFFRPDHQSHPKVRRAGPFGELLHDRAIKYTRLHGTGGRLTFSEVRSLMLDVEPVLRLPDELPDGRIRYRKATMRDLVNCMLAVRLFDPAGEDAGDTLFEVHDFHDYQYNQPNPDELAQRRAERDAKNPNRAEAGRKGGLTKAANKRAREAAATQPPSQASPATASTPSPATVAEAGSGSSLPLEDLQTEKQPPTPSESREASPATASQGYAASSVASGEGGEEFTSFEEEEESERTPAASGARIVAAEAAQEDDDVDALVEELDARIAEENRLFDESPECFGKTVDGEWARSDSQAFLLTGRYLNENPLWDVAKPWLPSNKNAWPIIRGYLDGAGLRGLERLRAFQKALAAAHYWAAQKGMPFEPAAVVQCWEENPGSRPQRAAPKKPKGEIRKTEAPPPLSREEMARLAMGVSAAAALSEAQQRDMLRRGVQVR